MRANNKCGYWSSLIWQHCALSTVFSCLLFVGCSSSGGSSDDSDTGISGQQNFIGTFKDHTGAPLAGLQVTLSSTGQQATTDASGTAQILTDTLLNGDIQLQVGTSKGEATLTLFGVTTEARIVSYGVSVNQTTGGVSVPSLRIAPLNSNSVALTNACQSCHGVIDEPDCSSDFWKSTHGSVYNCNVGQGGPASANNCQTCHGPRGSPQCGNPEWTSIHASYACTAQSGTQSPGSWSCVSCHENKGHIQCGNPTFEGAHKFASCDQGSGNNNNFHCYNCHTLKTVPDCNSVSWRNDHPFWSCGSGDNDCTTCHSYKGAPRCNDSYWKLVHGSDRCNTSASSTNCSSCHTAQIDTMCQDSSWKSKHNFFGTGSNIGKSDHLCASCHDNDRGPAKCDDPTWKAFHCFCG